MSGSESPEVNSCEEEDCIFVGLLKYIRDDEIIPWCFLGGKCNDFLDIGRMNFQDTLGGGDGCRGSRSSF